jgi:uncharacterized protein (TIGR00730 family)
LSPLRRVCVYCGSSFGARPAYGEAAVALGRLLAGVGIGLVYGGGGIGLMGAVADACLAAGGEVIGVIPRSLATADVAHAGLSELRVVESMHQRKAQMADLSDGFVALPGGLGTLEETAEALTWSQLGIQRKPVVLLDVEGYWQLLLAFLDQAVAEGFVPPATRDLVLYATSPEAALQSLATWEAPPPARRPVDLRPEER